MTRRRPSTGWTPTSTAPDVDLRWDAATDNTGVTGYRVKRNGGFIGGWSTDRTPRTT